MRKLLGAVALALALSACAGQPIPPSCVENTLKAVEDATAAVLACGTAALPSCIQDSEAALAAAVLAYNDCICLTKKEGCSARLQQMQQFRQLLIKPLSSGGEAQ